MCLLPSLKYGRPFYRVIDFSLCKWPPPEKKVYSAFNIPLQKNAQNSTMNLQESPTLKGRKPHVQLGHCGPHAIKLLTMNFAAAACYFASSCLCKIILQIWQLMKRVQQNKRLAKKISKVDLEKAVKAGCMHNLWLSLTRNFYSAISWTAVPLRHTKKVKLFKVCVTSFPEIS